MYSDCIALESEVLLYICSGPAHWLQTSSMSVSSPVCRITLKWNATGVVLSPSAERVHTLAFSFRTAGLWYITSGADVENSIMEALSRHACVSQSNPLVLNWCLTTKLPPTDFLSKRDHIFFISQKRSRVALKKKLYLPISNVLKHVHSEWEPNFGYPSLPTYLHTVKPFLLTEWKPSLTSAQVKYFLD